METYSRIMWSRTHIYIYICIYIYVLGSKNITAEVLNRLDTVDTNIPIKPHISLSTEHLLLVKEDGPHSVDCKIIMQYQ